MILKMGIEHLEILDYEVLATDSPGKMLGLTMPHPQASGAIDPKGFKQGFCFFKPAGDVGFHSPEHGNV